ncbi:MAG TPA: PAS domain S-box protein [Terriglobales bacterium]|nr:PAS domain S-box protein [Terriglobales bacterium]
MTNQHNPSSATPIHPDSPFQVVIVVCLTAILCYLAARLGGVLVIRPEMIWPVWPGCALLVAILLLLPGTVWPAVLIAGLSGFALYDAQESLPVRAIVLLLVADTIEILIAALGVRFAFGGLPHLKNVTSLAKYALFAVILAPVSVATAATSALVGDSWWIGFFTEALALLTLTPAILSWAEIAGSSIRKPGVRYLEAASMCIGISILSYFTFVAPGSESRPAMLYSLVPFLLWAALRFGITGVSNSITLVAFVSILGAIHKRGPFTADTPVHNVLSLQLFLLVAAASFMVLAAVVEQHKAAEQLLGESERTVRASEERLRLAQQAARIGTFECNVRTGVATWTPELESMYGLPPGTFGQTKTAFANLIHPDDRAQVMELSDRATKTGQPTTGEWRVLVPDGSIRWIAGRWQVFMNEAGEPLRVLGVNLDVTERKRAETALVEMNCTLQEQTALLQSREELLKIFVKNVPAGVAMLDRDMRYLQVSDRWCSDYRVESSQVIGRSHYEMFPDLPERWKEMHRLALKGETLRAEEDRWDRQGGPTTWLRWEIRPWRTPGGVVGGLLIFAEDITHRKQMEEALSGMSRKLIESQEQERARIGRELHDDINQRLAMLAVELEQLQDNPSEVQSRIQELRSRTAEISDDVQALSHELHSSKLEYLGVVAGMKSWCREFGERHKMQIGFRSQVLAPLPFDIGLSLFRVLQEALHNAAKHSRVKRVEVQLAEYSDEIHLIVRDSGAGFDVEAARQGTGLGLTSMQERVRLMNGTTTVESKPMQGTTIHARIPLGPEPSQRAAG